MTINGVIENPISSPNRSGTEYQIGNAVIESITSGKPLLIVRWNVPDSYHALSAVAKAYGRLATTDVNIVAIQDGKTIKETLPPSDLEQALKDRLSPEFEFLTAGTPTCLLYVQGPGHESRAGEIAVTVREYAHGMPETIAGVYHATIKSHRDALYALLSRVGPETFGK